MAWGLATYQEWRSLGFTTDLMTPPVGHGKPSAEDFAKGVRWLDAPFRAQFVESYAEWDTIHRGGIEGEIVEPEPFNPQFRHDHDHDRDGRTYFEEYLYVEFRSALGQAAGGTRTSAVSSR